MFEEFQKNLIDSWIKIDGLLKIWDILSFKQVQKLYKQSTILLVREIAIFQLSLSFSQQYTSHNRSIVFSFTL
jgi:hypothetical protein